MTVWFWGVSESIKNSKLQYWAISLHKEHAGRNIGRRPYTAWGVGISKGLWGDLNSWKDDDEGELSSQGVGGTHTKNCVAKDMEVGRLWGDLQVSSGMSREGVC